MLRDRGFATGGVVSTYVLRKETGINQGFDFFDDEMPPDSAAPAIEQGHRDGAESEAIAERWLDLQRVAAPVPVPAPERAARALLASGAVRRVHPLRRRNRLRGRDRRPADSILEVAPALRRIDDRPAVGSRRRARRSRRTGPRSVPLRRGDSRPADRQTGREHRRRPPDPRRRAARRHRTDDPRSRQGADPRQSARTIAQADSRRQRQSAGAGRLFGGSLRAVSLRLERADRAHRRALPLHPGADRRAVRSRARSSRTGQRRGRSRRRTGARVAARRARTVDHGRDDRRAGKSVGGGARTPAGARLRRADGPP